MNETVKTEKQYPEPGSRLENGAFVLAYRNMTVIALFGGEYVVWRCDFEDPRCVYNGSYFGISEFDSAVANYQQRSK